MARLHLALDPILAVRAPVPHEETLVHGYRLRLAGGPALAPGDPLLGAYGAGLVGVHVDGDGEEPLQHPGFDPGRMLRLLPDLDTPHWVEVWDEEGVRRAGTLTTDFEPVARAALDHGLELRAVALEERRSVDDDRRTGLRVLVHAPAFVGVEPAPAPFERPVGRRRRRLVLFADGRSDVRWWDPTASGGPIPADDLPVSPELARELDGLRERAAALADEDDIDWMAQLMRSEVDEQAVALWRRVRSELGARFVVGFLGRGMRHPVWSPAELEDDDAAELPF